MIPTPDPNSDSLLSKSPEELKEIQFKVGKIKLPEMYQKAVLNNPTSIMNFDEGYYQVSLPTSGYYYGILMVEIFIERGLASGVYANAIKLDMPIDKVRNVLSQKAKIQHRNKRSNGDDDLYGDAPIGIRISKNDKDETQTNLSCSWAD